MSELRYTIGIDPGTRTGLAIYDRQLDAIVYGQTLTFWKVFDVLKKYGPDEAEVIVEDCSMNKPRFRHKEGFRIQDRMSRNVGSVQRESVLIIEGIERLGYRVLGIKPTSGKWDDRTCKRVTRWMERTSQHVRDAIKLCYGVKQLRAVA